MRVRDEKKSSRTEKFLARPRFTPPQEKFKLCLIYRCKTYGGCFAALRVDVVGVRRVVMRACALLYGTHHARALAYTSRHAESMLFSLCCSNRNAVRFDSRAH
jgi:hypothetical protein